jgi:hypothetical protein
MQFGLAAKILIIGHIHHYWKKGRHIVPPFFSGILLKQKRMYESI